MGTGFLLGPSAVLTNYHVIELVQQQLVSPANVILRFDYKQLADGVTVNAGTEYRLAADWLIDYSRYSPVDWQGGEPQPDELDSTRCSASRASRGMTRSAGRRTPVPTPAAGLSPRQSLLPPSPIRPVYPAASRRRTAQAGIGHQCRDRRKVHQPPAALPHQHEEPRLIRLALL